MLTESNLEPEWLALPLHHCTGEITKGQRLATVVRALWTDLTGGVIKLHHDYPSSNPSSNSRSTQIFWWSCTWSFCPEHTGLSSVITPKSSREFHGQQALSVFHYGIEGDLLKELKNRQVWWKEKPNCFYIVVIFENSHSFGHDQHALWII